MNKKRFAFLSVLSISLSLSPIPANSAVKAGSACKKVGITSTASGKTFTCIKSGKKLVWNKGLINPKNSPPIKNVTYLEPSVLTSNVENCKIAEVSNSRGNTGAGFPEWKSLTKKTGTVTWALIPIDFPDLKGESNFRIRIDEQMKKLTDWYLNVSEGKLKIQWKVLDKWATLPEPSTTYNIEQSNNLDRVPNGIKLWKDAISSADPLFDFTDIQTVNLILPKGQTFLKETSQGFPWDKDVLNISTKEGSVSSFSIAGLFMDQRGREYWSYWAHEFGHAIGIPHIGLSRGTLPPFNPFDLMGSQDGPARELNGWLRFLTGWMPNESVYCKEYSNLNKVEITLVPLSDSRLGIKLAIIPLTQNKIVLIESRRFTKFSCGIQSKNGVLAYLYNSSLGHGEDFLVPLFPPNRPLEDHNQSATPCMMPPISDPYLYEGDSVIFEGIKIENIQHGNLDKIRITRN